MLKASIAINLWCTRVWFHPEQSWRYQQQKTCCYVIGNDMSRTQVVKPNHKISWNRDKHPIKWTSFKSMFWHHFRPYVDSSLTQLIHFCRRQYTSWMYSQDIRSIINIIDWKLKKALIIQHQVLFHNQHYLDVQQIQWYQPATEIIMLKTSIEINFWCTRVLFHPELIWSWQLLEPFLFCNWKWKVLNTIYRTQPQNKQEFRHAYH